MPHTIRLAWPWTTVAPLEGDAGGLPERVRLPVDLSDAVRQGPVVLCRSFNRPANLGGDTQVSLVLADCRGLASATLNGGLLHLHDGELRCRIEDRLTLANVVELHFKADPDGIASANRPLLLEIVEPWDDGFRADASTGDNVAAAAE